MNTIRTTAALIDYVNGGNEVKYLYFWGHQSSKSEINKTCFSQWYDSPFEVAGKRYLTAEHYMMAAKARLFNDTEAENRILSASNPGEAKKRGREVKNFDDEIWVQNRFEIVVEANLHKFNQHPELKDFILKTENRVLVEASPVDKIWGVGLAVDNSAVENPNKWKGLNLLGFALMEVRAQLSQS